MTLLEFVSQHIFFSAFCVFMVVLLLAHFADCILVWCGKKGPEPIISVKLGNKDDESD